MGDTFTPKAGMVCRTRDGQKVGPIRPGQTSNPAHYWVADGRFDDVFVVMAWHKDGSFWPVGHPSRKKRNEGFDLIAEWTEYRPEDDGWDAVNSKVWKIPTDGWPDQGKLVQCQFRVIDGKWYSRPNGFAEDAAPSLPGLPISELGAKPGDTIRCVWIPDGWKCEYPVGFSAKLRSDMRFYGRDGKLWWGSEGRWEIVKRADKPKGRKRARIKELEAKLLRKHAVLDDAAKTSGRLLDKLSTAHSRIQELEAQVAELTRLGDEMDKTLRSMGFVPNPFVAGQTWREAVARIKP